ncbi:MAG TPA: hypothetical protein VMW38_06830, partial [Terriglobia bacterium]|nr:hypothetical protein [Terriglobia bacterium]
MSNVIDRLLRHKAWILALLLILIVLVWFANLPRSEKRPDWKGNPLSRVYVFAATPSEGRTVERLMNPVQKLPGQLAAWSGQIGSNNVSLFVTGVGPRKAEAGVGAALGLGNSVQQPQSVVTGHPDAIFIVGLCGSLDASIGENVVVSYSECLSTDKNQPRVSCSTDLTGEIMRLLNSKGIGCRSIVGIISPRVATSKSEKLQLAATGANAVDMESYQIVSAANQIHVPVAVNRVVSDSLDCEMPDFNRALKPDGEVDSLKVAKIFLGSPMTSLKLLSISRSSTQKLKEALEIILSAGISSSAWVLRYSGLRDGIL